MTDLELEDTIVKQVIQLNSALKRHPLVLALDKVVGDYENFMSSQDDTENTLVQEVMNVSDNTEK